MLDNILIEEIPNEDSNYLNKLKDIINQNISNSEFSVSTLSSNMAQSQSALQKKVKSLTGNTASEIIRDMRMQHAAVLLANSKDISYVAYAVGYSDRKYFSKEFKKSFGKNPSDYQREKI